MELPLKEIVFEPGKSVLFGLFANSLVGSPAILEGAVHFSSEQTNFSINEDQRIIFGPVLIPDQLVYRNQGGVEYNLTARRETIELIAIDFAANGRMNNVNLNHQEEIIPGVVIFQQVLTNENTIPHVKGYEHLPVGTLFHGAKITNDEVWAEVKSGKYKGWSIHAYFEQELLTMSANAINDYAAILEEIYNNI